MSVPRSSWYPGYVLLMLAIANLLNAIDRNIVGLLAEPIKHELQITDTQLGLLTGFAFALFYVTFGVPIARWSDRGNRRTILALGIGLWSLMTAVFGWATSFTMLLIARIGVGIGEAAATPPAMSLIADYFPREKRPRAISIFQSAIFVGLAGTAVVGWFAHSHGWRNAFVLLGAVGVLFAIVFRLTVAEPERGVLDSEQERRQSQPPFGESIRLLLSQRGYVLILVSMAATAMSAASLSAWAPAFLIRVHGLSVAEVASVVGPANGLGGFVGALVGGFLTVHVVSRTGQSRWTLLIPGVALLLAVPTALLFIFSGSVRVALVALGLEAFFWAMKSGPCYALALGLVPASMRAFAVAVVLFASGVVGNGVGPLLVGVVSDAIGPALGAHAIQYALIFCPIAMLAGALALLAAVRPFAESSQQLAAGR